MSMSEQQMNELATEAESEGGSQQVKTAEDMKIEK